MILVGQFDNPVTRRVGASLHPYGSPFTPYARSIFGDAAEIAKITPMIRIPALILEGGEVLIDSGAILDYLDEQVGPIRALIPPSGPIRRVHLFDDFGEGSRVDPRSDEGLQFRVG